MAYPKSYQYNNIVSMDGLADAAAMGVELALQDQFQASTSAQSPIGPTTGMYPSEPIDT